MTEGTPRGINPEEATFAQPKRLVPVVNFVPEGEKISWEQRIETGKVLMLIGMMEILKVRDEVSASISFADELFVARFSSEATNAKSKASLLLDVAEGETFGSLLRRYRKGKAGMTLDELERASSVNHVTISRLESGLQVIRTRTLKKIAKGFGWSEDDPRYMQLFDLRVQEYNRAQEEKIKRQL